MTKAESYLNEALLLAEKAAENDEVPVGAVIVSDGKIISRGFNFRETTQNPLSHAEVHALMQASSKLNSWRLNGCEIYVTLEPCPMCLAAMVQARISKCVYGAADSKGGALSLGYRLHEDERLNHRFTVEYLPMENCGKILTDFFKKKRGK
jgi:tRNA(adenine34) deaminase